jgi:hypothetical protein
LASTNIERKFLVTMPSRKPQRSKKVNSRPKPAGWDRRKEAGWDSRFIRGRIESDDRAGNVSVSLGFFGEGRGGYGGTMVIISTGYKTRMS